MLTDGWPAVVFSLAPTILIGVIFWFAMRAILRSDRTERDVRARIEAEERAKRAAAAGESPADHPRAS